MTEYVSSTRSACCQASISRPTPGQGPWSCDNCHREVTALGMVIDAPAWPEALNLTAAAMHVVSVLNQAERETPPDSSMWEAGRAYAVLAMWEDLTGLKGEAAKDYARLLHARDGADVVAHVAPF